MMEIFQQGIGLEDGQTGFQYLAGVTRDISTGS